MKKKTNQKLFNNKIIKLKKLINKIVYNKKLLILLIKFKK